MDNNTLTVGLSVIFSVVLVGPFLNKWVESNLEIFLFVMRAMDPRQRHAACADHGSAPCNCVCRDRNPRLNLKHHLRHYRCSAFGGVHHGVTATPACRGESND